ncbi:PIN domain-containing protein [Thermoflexibacter ruber]|uniref:PIN domain-containing protein n=1 Tax=Thermoflexibacter ruber TaxID=1003 RepID=A0A1I2JSR3_9BACT|nr:PIN domain-containing protein [Thermoflexibacter ruber]SFF56147.1 PIN domain-containing protein [Thermoflexibacter ruber]
MTDFVIDANVLMSILISGKAGYRPILTFNNFILPEFALIEVEKYKDILKDKTKMSEIQFIDWTYFVFAQLTILPQYVLEQTILDKAERLLEKIDLKDISYVALAMQLDLLLLTRDNPLYEGLRKQGFRKVMLFEDFLRTL